MPLPNTIYPGMRILTGQHIYIGCIMQLVNALNRTIDDSNVTDSVSARQRLIEASQPAAWQLCYLTTCMIGKITACSMMFHYNPNVCSEKRHIFCRPATCNFKGVISPIMSSFPIIMGVSLGGPGFCR